MGRKNNSGHYVKNADLLTEIIVFKQTGVITENLGRMLLSIANNYTTKGNYIGYTWKSDMVGDAMLTCIKYLKNFDPARSSNAFSYCTQICSNSFKAYIKAQKKHSIIKDRCYQGYADLVEYTINDGTKAIDYEILSPGKKRRKKIVKE